MIKSIHPGRIKHDGDANPPVKQQNDVVYVPVFSICFRPTFLLPLDNQTDPIQMILALIKLSSIGLIGRGTLEIYRVLSSVWLHGSCLFSVETGPSLSWSVFSVWRKSPPRRRWRGSRREGERVRGWSKSPGAPCPRRTSSRAPRPPPRPLWGW